LADILPICVTWAVGGSLLLAGAGLTGNRGPPEFHIAAGWGGLCLLLTSWGVFVPLRMQLPAAAFIIAALTVMLLPKRRPSAGAWLAPGKMLAVSLPLWLVMAPIRPSQPDTFLNLLPNAFYLVDYGLLPTAARPPSYSLLPAAPYNTQFLSFLGSLLDVDYPAQGMTLVNVMLQLAAGLAIARALGSSETLSGRPPSWGLTALGFLLATLFNPGFVPRIHFAAYGEPALAAMAVIAAWLFVLAQGELARRNRPTARDLAGRRPKAGAARAHGARAEPGARSASSGGLRPPRARGGGLRAGDPPGPPSAGTRPPAVSVAPTIAVTSSYITRACSAPAQTPSAASPIPAVQKNYTPPAPSSRSAHSSGTKRSSGSSSVRHWHRNNAAGTPPSISPYPHSKDTPTYNPYSSGKDPSRNKLPCCHTG